MHALTTIHFASDVLISDACTAASLIRFALFGMCTHVPRVGCAVSWYDHDVDISVQSDMECGRFYGVFLYCQQNIWLDFIMTIKLRFPYPESVGELCSH